MRTFVSAHVSHLRHYPDPDCTALIEAAAEHYGAGTDCLLAGDGSSELLYALLPLLGVTRAVIPVPSYRDYAAAAERAGIEGHAIPYGIDSLTSALEQQPS